MNYKLGRIVLNASKYSDSLLVGEGNFIEKERIEIHEEDFNDLINFLEKKGYNTTPLVRENPKDLTYEETKLIYYEDKTRKKLLKYENKKDFLDTNLNKIMTEMEQDFKIPTLPDSAYEKRNPDVVRWYKQIIDFKKIIN